MGNIFCGIKDRKTDENIVTLKAFELQQFFYKYYDVPEKKQLLEHIPIECNFMCDLKNMVACSGYHFMKASKPLSFHMQLLFDYDCKIIISKEYYEKLNDFSKKTKTNEEIVQEYYENTSN